jgi:hypothetical protein
VSAKFFPAEANYDSNEQEWLAEVLALWKYRPLLKDGRFTLRTDNAVLTWLDRVQDERKKLMKCAMFLKRCSFNVEKCRGKIINFPTSCLGCLVTKISGRTQKKPKSS